MSALFILYFGSLRAAIYISQYIVKRQVLAQSE